MNATPEHKSRNATLTKCLQTIAKKRRSFLLPHKRLLRCKKLMTNSSDETQRYQLRHYDVVVAQLVALGFIKSV
jgi:hypothetical protein